MANIDINMLQYISLQKSVAQNSDVKEPSLEDNNLNQEVNYNNWEEFKRALDNCKVIAGETVLDSSGDIYKILTSRYFRDENGEIQKQYTYEKLITSAH